MTKPNLTEMLLNAKTPIVAPLCLDPLMARIAELAGFGWGYISGGALGYSYGVSEALLTTTEVADVTRRVTQRCNLNIIVDVGVGFGDPVHVTRTVWEMEQAGAAAIEIEDQVAPKRVSHHRGIEHLVSTELMVQKIEQAVAARRSEDFQIIARTGAVKNESFSAALDRLSAYRSAGADVLMLMPENDEQIAQVRATFDGALATITAMDNVTKVPWQDSGWNLVIDPFTAQVISVQAVQAAYSGFQQNGSTTLDLKDLFATYHTLDSLAGLDELYAIEDVTTEAQSALE